MRGRPLLRTARKGALLMADSILPPSSEGPLHPRRSAFNRRDRQAGDPSPESPPAADFAAHLLPDDPGAVPFAELWVRLPMSSSGATHTERLVAGLATALAPLLAPARRLTGALDRRPPAARPSGAALAGTGSLRLPGFHRFWPLYAG